MKYETVEVTTFAGLYTKENKKCEHVWAAPAINYELKCTPYYSRVAEVRTCLKCLKDIRVGGCGMSRDIEKGRDLISEIARERGTTDPIPRPAGAPTVAGSGWWLELPTYVCSLIDEQGNERAREYINWIFDQESSWDAFDKLHARCPEEPE